MADPTPNPLAIVQLPGSRLRSFSDAKISEAVTKMLSDIPEGKHAQLFAVADLDGARVGLAWKIHDGEKFDWSIVGTFERKWNGDLGGELAMKLEI